MKDIETDTVSADDDQWADGEEPVIEAEVGSVVTDVEVAKEAEFDLDEVMDRFASWSSEMIGRLREQVSSLPRQLEGYERDVDMLETHLRRSLRTVLRIAGRALK